MKKVAHSSANRIGIIILAAGASRRMGTPKQLLKIGAETLLERAIRITEKIANQETLIVLGANATKIQAAVDIPTKNAVIINNDWQKGMGTTLRSGISYFLKKQEIFTAVIVMVCDQPYLTTEKLVELIETHEKTKANIVATTYGGINGVPTLFSQKLFSKLAELNEDEGARKIIKRYKGGVATVDFPKGSIDLDTPTAYQNFLKKNIKK